MARGTSPPPAARRSVRRHVGSSMGVTKAHCGRLGISYDLYRAKVDRGEKWCTGSKRWHLLDQFQADKSRHDGLSASCRKTRLARYRSTYVPVGRKSKRGSLLAETRDGDKRQARARVNHQVDIGARPRPNDLPCEDCGHAWASGERRHEYDHYLGYGMRHQLDVQAVCTTCHHNRERARKCTARRSNGPGTQI